MSKAVHPQHGAGIARRRAARLAGLPGLCAVLFALAACTGDTDPFKAYHEARYHEARAGFERLAEEGDLAATNALGVIHLLGLDGERDLPRARELFLRAARGGHADAQRNVGMLHERGLAVPRNLMRAYGWYDLAARSGHEPARAQAETLGAQLSANMARQGREEVEAFMQSGNVPLP